MIVDHSRAQLNATEIPNSSLSKCQRYITDTQDEATRLLKLSTQALFLAATILLALLNSASAEDVERDKCSCKVVMKGAESTLKDGVCVRTEANACLMEWGGGSNSKVTLGYGLEQREAAAKALAELNKGAKVEIVQIAPVPDGASPLERAVANLTVVPPEAYGRAGMIDSFLLTAGTALARFKSVDLTFLASFLMIKAREPLIRMVQKEGRLEIGQYVVQGSAGCLRIEARDENVSVYVKTPFAISRGC